MRNEFQMQPLPYKSRVFSNNPRIPSLRSWLRANQPHPQMLLWAYPSVKVDRLDGIWLFLYHPKTKSMLIAKNQEKITYKNVKTATSSFSRLRNLIPCESAINQIWRHDENAQHNPFTKNETIGINANRSKNINQLTRYIASRIRQRLLYPPECRIAFPPFVTALRKCRRLRYAFGKMEKRS